MVVSRRGFIGGTAALVGVLLGRRSAATDVAHEKPAAEHHWCKVCQRRIPVEFPTEGGWHMGAVCSECGEPFYVKMLPPSGVGPWAERGLGGG